MLRGFRVKGEPGYSGGWCIYRLSAGTKQSAETMRACVVCCVCCGTGTTHKHKKYAKIKEIINGKRRKSQSPQQQKKAVSGINFGCHAPINKMHAKAALELAFA